MTWDIITARDYTVTSEHVVDGLVSVLIAAGVGMYGAAAGFYLAINAVTDELGCLAFASSGPCHPLVAALDGMAVYSIIIGSVAMMMAVGIRIMQEGWHGDS